MNPAGTAHLYTSTAKSCWLYHGSKLITVLWNPVPPTPILPFLCQQVSSMPPSLVYNIYYIYLSDNSQGQREKWGRGGAAKMAVVVSPDEVISGKMGSMHHWRVWRGINPAGVLTLGLAMNLSYSFYLLQFYASTPPCQQVRVRVRERASVICTGVPSVWERERERERGGGGGVGGYQRTISARLQRSVAPEWVPPTTDKSGRGLRSDVFHGYWSNSPPVVLGRHTVSERACESGEMREGGRRERERERETKGESDQWTTSVLVSRDQQRQYGRNARLW